MVQNRTPISSSGIAQEPRFVYRAVTLLPGARYSRAVAANSGVYLLPEYSLPYPLGLKDAPLPESNLSKVFAHKLTVMSGGSNKDPNDPGLANFPRGRGRGCHAI
ncbi:MAG: hypothetical protein NTV68_10550 [Methanomicrobiales archaeon]|nr:hypothetical protein [Methanomicrobiales archaeon]